MYIQCEKDGWYDRFYLPKINNLEVLREYKIEKQPIEAYKIEYSHTGHVFFKEESIRVNLYLHSYQYHYEIFPSVMIKSDYEELQKTYCNNCSRYNDFMCEGKLTYDGCESFIKKLLVIIKERIRK